MLWMISKFIFCLLMAGALGFILGFIFAKLLQRDKANESYALLEDRYDNQKALANQYLSELKAKENEIELIMKRYQNCQKELEELKLDHDELKQSCKGEKELSELELENNTLKEEIAEYQYLENENALLLDEIKTLENEKEELLNRLQKCDEAEISQISTPTPEHVENEKEKMLKKEIKRAKKSISKAYKLLKK